tara:strand:+ start:632 stop:1330 length:699 start_codon:yes stop_codon:yes gene_type:complete
MLEVEELFVNSAMSLQAKPLLNPEKQEFVALRNVLHGKEFVAGNVLGGAESGDVHGDGASEQALGEEFRKAYEKGMQEAKDSIEAMQQRYQDAIADLAFLREQVLQESEEALLRLAYATAKEIVLDDVDARKDFTEKMVEHALGLLRESDKIVMRVAPDDVIWLKEKRPDLFSEKSIVHIQEDPSLVLGGVVAECNLGKVDASMERRLSDVAANLIRGTTQSEDEDDLKEES